MDRPVQMLKDAWKEQSSAQFLIESTMTQMEHTTRSMILSMGYHLYGSQQLMTMKTFFENPNLLDRSGLEKPFHDRPSGTLEKALIMAAEMLRSDCQTGLGYIKSLGNLRFAPVSAIAPYEGGAFKALCVYSGQDSKAMPQFYSSAGICRTKKRS
ncbi:hypothetical protein NW767_014972 [Fusarium falciforme]|nr:hypothetical protein NW767_014972 [Fusarium falciforme]